MFEANVVRTLYKLITLTTHASRWNIFLFPMRMRTSYSGEVRIIFRAYGVERTYIAAQCMISAFRASSTLSTMRLAMVYESKCQSAANIRAHKELTFRITVGGIQ